MKTGGMKKKLAWGAAAVAAGVVVPLAVAWACTALASLKLTPNAATTGQVVQAEGYGFAAGPRGLDVEVRWNNASGPLLATAKPNDRGGIKFSFVAPSGQPGYYTVIASQRDASGQPVAGTPSRATLALNNPPPRSANGAGGLTTVDQEMAAQAPSTGDVHHAAPGQGDVYLNQAAPGAQARQQQASGPAAVSGQAAAGVPRQLPAIPPSGARSRDVLAPAASRGGASLGGQVGLTMSVLGALLLASVAAGALIPRRARQRRL